MNRLVLIASGVAVIVLPAPEAHAQTAPQAAPSASQLGLRYLDWPGKPARRVAEAPVPARRPAPAPGPAPAPARTAPPPPPAPAPVAVAAPTPAARPVPVAAPAAPAPGSSYGLVAPSPYVPDHRGLTAASMLPVGPADPRAPRTDAPIFRMARPEAPVAAAPVAPVPAPHAAAAPAPERADDDPRYYSVHRLAGRDPDPIPLPAPFFLDAAPVDLAEPPPPPAIIRNGAGAVAPVPEPDLP